MRTLKLTSLLSVLCLLGTAATHHHGGCLSVQKITGLPERSCNDCYRRKPNAPKSVGCGPLVSEQDKCRFYQYLGPRRTITCSECLAGYASVIANTSCVPGTVQGCVSEFLYPNHEHLCFACENGYASTNNTAGTSKCIPSSQVENPIANCVWGGIYKKGSQGTLIS